MFKFTAALLLMAACCCAGTITYDIDLTVGLGGVTGDIVTDGTIGTLTNANIVGWNLTLNDGTDPTATLTVSNSEVQIVPPNEDVSATPTQLSFNFNAVTGPEAHFFGFFANESETAVCWSIAPFGCAMPGEGASGLSLIVDGNKANAQFTGLTPVGTTGPTTPEPSTLALLGLGMAALGFCKFRVGRSS